MMTLRHITRAEVQHQKESESERKFEREREGKYPNREREQEGELGMFSMMGFDSATSIFLALLVKKSYSKKLKKFFVGQYDR